MEYSISLRQDLDTMTQSYGVMARDGERLFSVTQNGNPLTFDSGGEAKDFVEQMNSLPRCGVCGKPMTEAMPTVEDVELGTCCAEHSA